MRQLSCNACINRGLKPAHSTHQPLVDYYNKYSNVYTRQPVAMQRFLLYCDPFSGQYLGTVIWSRPRKKDWTVSQSGPVFFEDRNTVRSQNSGPDCLQISLVWSGLWSHSPVRPVYIPVFPCFAPIPVCLLRFRCCFVYSVCLFRFRYSK